MPALRWFLAGAGLVLLAGGGAVVSVDSVWSHSSVSIGPIGPAASGTFADVLAACGGVLDRLVLSEVPSASSLHERDGSDAGPPSRWRTWRVSSGGGPWPVLQHETWSPRVFTLPELEAVPLRGAGGGSGGDAPGQPTGSMFSLRMPLGPAPSGPAFLFVLDRNGACGTAAFVEPPLSVS